MDSIEYVELKESMERYVLQGGVNLPKVQDKALF